jgi:calcium-dependent protein kinase
MDIDHRDLKLENFLFETKSSSSPLILIDFGLSKNFEPNERLTQRVGSCYYTGLVRFQNLILIKSDKQFSLSVAPEVLNGCYDNRCDNWSLGVLCYMLLSGSPPFHGKTVDDVYNSTLTQEATFPEKKFRYDDSSPSSIRQFHIM